MFVNTPPLGWNTWNTFGANINEELILQAADAMIETGLKDAGYNYVVIDDIWALKERDQNGRLVPDPQKFPHGMKYIADYLHQRGLKFGMYSCAGYLTCAGYPASFEHEWDDAKSFAEWEVDFLKYDYCFHPVSVRADICINGWGWHSLTADGISCFRPAPGAAITPAVGLRKPVLRCGALPATSWIPGLPSGISPSRSSR